MKKKMIWALGVLVLCVLAGCSGVQGTGSKEDPYPAYHRAIKGKSGTI